MRKCSFIASVFLAMASSQFRIMRFQLLMLMLISAVAVVDCGLVPVDAYAGCLGKWVAGAAYVSGSFVSMKDASMNTQILSCKSTGVAAFSNQVGYEPLAYGGAWQHSWEVIKPCSGNIAPSTAAPASTKSGCPSKWVAGAVYVAGSLVSMNCQILRCKSTAAMPTLDKLCNQVGFEPFSVLWWRLAACLGSHRALLWQYCTINCSSSFCGLH